MAITATHVETSLIRKAVTDDQGGYLITSLPVGSYSIEAEKTGFRRFVQNGATLEVNQNARVDPVLTVGQLSESITVTAEVTGVDTRSSTVGEFVDRLRVQELPLNGRNAMELARIVPGVTSRLVPADKTTSRPASGLPGIRWATEGLRSAPDMDFLSRIIGPIRGSIRP